MVVSTNQPNSNRKRKTEYKDHISNNIKLVNQTKKESFSQDQQNSSELSDNNTSMSEIRPILETYEQQLQMFQTSQTFGTLTTDTDQPLTQTVSCHNEFQPMDTATESSYGSSCSNKFLWRSRYC